MGCTAPRAIAYVVLLAVGIIENATRGALIIGLLSRVLHRERPKISSIIIHVTLRGKTGSDRSVAWVPIATIASVPLSRVVLRGEKRYSTPNRVYTESQTALGTLVDR